MLNRVSDFFNEGVFVSSDFGFNGIVRIRVVKRNILLKENSLKERPQFCLTIHAAVEQHLCNVCMMNVVEADDFSGEITVIKERLQCAWGQHLSKMPDVLFKRH